MVLTAVFLKETVNVKKERTSPKTKLSFQEFINVMLTHPIGLIIFAFFMLNFAFSSMQGTFALWAEHTLGFGPTEIGYIFTFIGIGAIITQLLILPRVVDRFGERPVFIYATLLLAIGLLIMPFSLHLSLLIVSNLLLILGNGLAGPTSQSIASENVSPEEYGGTMGIMHSGASLGRILGPIIGGYFFNLINPNTPFIIAGVIVFLIFFMLRSFLNREPAFFARLRHRWVVQ
jgi:MFS family permease